MLSHVNFKLLHVVDHATASKAGREKIPQSLTRPSSDKGLSSEKPAIHLTGPDGISPASNTDVLYASHNVSRIVSHRK